MAPLEFTLIRSRVGRRMAGLFLLCAIGPIVGLALITSWRLEGYLRAQEEAHLRSAAKDASMQAIGRLLDLENRLRLIGAQPARGLTRDALPEVNGLVRLDGRAAHPVFGEVVPPELDAEGRTRLLSGLPLLLPPAAPHGVLRLVVPLAGTAADAPRALVAAVDTRLLWGLDDRVSDGRVTREVCGAIGPVVLDCADGSLPLTGLDGPLRGGTGAGSFATADYSGHEWLGAYWSAPLEAHFAVPRWTAIVLAESNDVLAPVRATLRLFGLVVVATLCAVLLVSLSQIRHQLDPIARLQAGTARIARGELDARVQVSSGDELQDLAEAFNRMAGELQQQFAQLHALSVGTLEALARAIDAKSPWTAGHSTRVTVVAVSIARALGYDEAGTERVRRGGLLHDLGKIGIPATILDKRDELTPAERAIIEEHPALGARILEPLPHCRDLLPMVVQHHERLDGSGYPLGLRGDAIALDARILAVADVYDAMTSDRPYRRGLRHEDVVEYITSLAGIHFDVQVVTALHRAFEAEGIPHHFNTRELARSA